MHRALHHTTSTLFHIVAQHLYHCFFAQQRLRFTHESHLALPALRSSAQKAYVFPNLRSGNLLSVSHRCDNNYMVIFDKTHVQVLDKNNIVLKGKCSNMNSLYNLPLQNDHTRTPYPLPVHTANNINAHNQHKPIHFLHAACFSPVKSTWLKAISAGFFSTWP